MNLFELYHKYMTTRQDRAYYDLTVACHIKNGHLYTILHNIIM